MLIGLNGRKQAGKDTVYARARHLMGDRLPVERASFADLLYRSAAASLGVTEGFLQTFKSEPLARIQVILPPPNGVLRSELTVREYLQRYGTEAHREVFGEDFWVEPIDLSHENRLVFVTDVRFPNEARAIHRNGGFVVEVIGPDGRVTDDAHASEAPLDDNLIYTTINNTERRDEFRALDLQVKKLIIEMKEIDEVGTDGMGSDEFVCPNGAD